MDLLANLHLQSWLTPERISQGIRLLLIISIGFPLIKLISRVTAKVTSKHLTAQTQMLIRKVVYYSGLTFLLISVLNELGFKISALLGAAGIFGVAIGFASQTSVSNIISGIFLIVEKPFAVGDSIQVGKTTGTILSIDLLSVKLKTADNSFVRIPNENLIKSEIVNTSRFENRRLDTKLTLSYHEDIHKAIAILEEMSKNNALILNDPEPLIHVSTLGENSVQILFGLWCTQADYTNLQHHIHLEIKDKFDKAKISLSNPAYAIKAQV